MLVNGVHLLPDLSGAVYWPARRLLAVADLHLEKGSALARRGVLLPPYDTRATLDRLGGLLRRHAPRTVVCLGDSFHDAGGPGRMVEAEAEELRRMVAAREWIWIAGNHDPAPAGDLGGEWVAEFAVDGLVFRHAPLPDAAPGEVAGHLHPKATVGVGGQRVTRPCFVTDGRRLVLPAFGAYAGGLDVLDPAWRPLFPRRAFDVVMLGGDRLHTLPRGRLLAG